MNDKWNRFNTVFVACVIGACARNVFALDTVPYAVEAVPPSKHRHVAFSTRDTDTMPHVEDRVTQKTRPLAWVRLQPVEPIIDIAADNFASRQSEVDWEFRRQDRLARFMMMAASNATAIAHVERPLRRVRGENTPDM